MTNTDTYINNLDSSQQKVIKTIVNRTLSQLPNAELRMSYGVPCFFINGKYLFGIGGFSKHMSIFPGAEPIEKLQKNLKSYKLSKGTIQFTKDNPLSSNLLNKIIKICIERVER